MYYKLNPDIALRSWPDYPYGYYIRNNPVLHPLTRETFLLLSECDSMHDLPDSPEIALFRFAGLISPCEKGEKTFSEWQMQKCDNRHFPSLNWMITGKCNYNCLHCFNAADNNRLQSEFTLEEAEKLICEAHTADTLWRQRLAHFNTSCGKLRYPIFKFSVPCHCSLLSPFSHSTIPKFHHFHILTLPHYIHPSTNSRIAANSAPNRFNSAMRRSRRPTIGRPRFMRMRRGTFSSAARSERDENSHGWKYVTK